MCQWLLAHNYLLSALELLVEAQEAGKETEVARLTDYFSNKERFPPEEVAKHGALGGAWLCGMSCVVAAVARSSCNRMNLLRAQATDSGVHL